MDAQNRSWANPLLAKGRNRRLYVIDSGRKHLTAFDWAYREEQR